MRMYRKIKIHLLTARAWSMQCGLWSGRQHACGEKTLWTGQVVRLPPPLGTVANASRFPSTQIQAAASWSRSARCNIHGTSSGPSKEAPKRGWQDVARKTLLQDHTQLWNNRQQQSNSLLPEFRHKGNREAQWLDDCSQPAWVDRQLATPDECMDRNSSVASPCSLSADNADQLIGPESEKRVTFESVKKLCQEGKVKEAVEALDDLVEMNFEIDKHLFYCVLKECVGKKDLMLGGQVHALAVKTGLSSNTFLCNHFIRMYAAQGKLQEAMNVFRGVALPDAYMWSSLISAHVKQGHAKRAIELYQQMVASRTKPNRFVLVSALQACAAAGDLQLGKQVHNDAFTRGMEHDTLVCNCLVDMYAKCGSLKDAQRVFDGLSEKTVVTWSAMIAGYARVQGMGQQALSLYSAMHKEGVVAPNVVTFICLLQACANVGTSALEEGKQVHSQLKDRRLESDVVVGGSLVNMYAKCGSLKDARRVFDGLREKSVVTWNAMIAGYAQQEGMGHEAFSLYSSMRSEGIAAPNAVTFVCLLQACANLGASALEEGKQFHLQLKDRRFETDVVVGGSLVNMYIKCGSLEDARIVFEGLREKNVVTWNVMISGYAQQEGLGQEALSLHNAMQNEGIAAPDAATFVCLLQACANVGMSALEKGRQLHSQLKHQKLESDVVVGGSLVNMYAKCGSLNDARRVFNGLSEKDVVSWTAMISGYGQQEGMGQEALNLYCAMRKEGIATPNAVTYVCLLEACASVGALQQGKKLHAEIREVGLETNVLIGTCLVKMYAKCGCLEVSREVFDKLPMKDVVLWNALLKEYAEHGKGVEAIQFFEELLAQKVQPDEVTYTCLLTACSHAGLMDQGHQYFVTMVEQHGVEPNERHFCCMVDLFGRSGHLDKAERLLRISGLASNAVSWKALLSACKTYGDAETGSHCFDHLVTIEPTVATAYALMGSIYASVGRWDEVDRVESLRKAAGAKKMAAKACIEVKRGVHEFTVGEERSDVAATLRKMNTRVKEGGHVPQTQLVLRAVSEQDKQDALCGHAEKLALAYGLLHTPAGSTLVVTKNLRMCNDCHSSTKIMSRLEKREIVVRDGHKVHCFQNGACSCLDRP